MTSWMKSLIERYSSNKLVINYLKVFSIDVFVKASGVLLLPLYLKLMTQEEFGLYGYLFAIGGTFSLVFNLGIYAGQSKLYHEYSGNDRSRMLYTLNILLAVFLVVSFATMVVADWDKAVIRILFSFPIDYSKYRIPVLLGLVVNVYSLLLTNFFLTSDKITKLQQFNAVRIIGINVIVILVLWLLPYDDHAWLRLTTAYAVETLIVIYYSKYYWKEMLPQFDREVAKRALKIGVPIVFSAMLGILINLGDRYFLEKHGSMHDLSIYNVALTFASIVPFVFTSFQNVWLPLFLKETDVQSNRSRTRKMVIRLLFSFIALSILLVAGVKFTLITGIIDEKYALSLNVLPFLLVSAIMTSLSQLYANHLILLDKLKYVIIVGVPVAIISYTLNKNLVPVWGIYGAASSSIIANASYLGAYALIVSWLYKKKAAKEITL